MKINDNIKLIRELSGKRQADFAQLIKTNLSNLKTYESSKSNVNPKTPIKIAIAKIGGVSLEDLETKILKPEDIKIKMPSEVEKDGKDVPTVTRETSENEDQNIVQEFLKTTAELIAGQNKLIDAHKDLTYSNTVLADTQKKLVNKLTTNSDDSSDTPTKEEFDELLLRLGQKLAGQKVDSASKFVRYAMKQLAEIRSGVSKDSNVKGQKSTQPVPQES